MGGGGGGVRECLGRLKVKVRRLVMLVNKRFKWYFYSSGNNCAKLF